MIEFNNARFFKHRIFNDPAAPSGVNDLLVDHEANFAARVSKDEFS